MKTKLIIILLTVVCATIVAAKTVFAEENNGYENRNERAVTNTDRGDGDKARTTSADDDEEVNRNEDASGTPKNEQGESESEAHRSTVSTFVQNLLKMAERNNGGIGEQVRVIAKNQEDDTPTTTKAIRETEGRGKFLTFLIGTDYKNIGVIRSSIVTTNNRIGQLARIVDTLSTSTEKTELLAQINLLEQEQTKLENFVESKESTFSLFGWFVKLFYPTNQ